MNDIVIRASQVPNWNKCPRRAEYEASVPPDQDSLHVGLIFGRKVHSFITGQVSEEDTKPILYDSVTRDPEELQKQTAVTAKKILRWMDKKGMVIMERELAMAADASIGDTTIRLTGHLDFTAIDELKKTHLVDLKTGKTTPEKVFVQLAMYAWLYHANTGRTLDYCTGIWATRKNNKIEIIAHSRPFENLMKEAETFIKGLKRNIHHGCVPCPSALNCHKCDVSECSVRSFNSKIN